MDSTGRLTGFPCYPVRIDKCGAVKEDAKVEGPGSKGSCSPKAGRGAEE